MAAPIASGRATPMALRSAIHGLIFCCSKRVRISQKADRGADAILLQDRMVTLWN